jgi:hypothetical protein
MTADCQSLYGCHRRCCYHFAGSGRAEAGATVAGCIVESGNTVPDGFDGFHCKGLHGGPNDTPILFPTTPRVLTINTRTFIGL